MMNTFFDSNKHIGILLLRTFIGLRLFYGVIDNVISWEQMTEFATFLNANQFPFPLLSAITSVYAQFLGAILILVGFKIRIASFFMAINFMVALVFVHIKAGDSIEGMTPALAMLFGCLTFLFTGADKVSVDRYLE